uniref:Transposon TX1 uncharacterized n=1 Tax=Cajanus cajan TaxID=3821 RepID=A0A151T3Q3_CAJCA|nr:Transposon TX1 uncharacterized [Cajanus cajan]
MRLFSDFVNSSGLLDLQMFGRQFTWFRNDGKTMSRFDRYLVSVDFASSREGLEKWGLPRGMSDHCPVLLKTGVSEWGPKPFRVLNCWFDDIRFKPFVEDAWGRMEIRGKKCFVLKEKLKELKKRLKIWNKEEFGDINKNIELLHEEIHNLESKEEEAGLEEEELSHLNLKRGELQKWVSHQCSILHQKSRVQWLREGDVNSKYFHRSIARHRKSNEIRCLDFDGELVEEKTHMHRKVKDFFERHFRESNKARPRLGEWRFSSLSEGERFFLETPFSETEIKEAVWSCDGNKCPGPDGFNLRFIKEFWDTLKEDFVGFFDEFFVNGKLVKGVNNSFITLIPKNDNPQGLGDYRPISLIGSVYKVLTKVLANRMSRVMPTIISGSQSAFVKGRGLRQGDPLSPFLFLIAAEGLNQMVQLAVSLDLWKSFIVGKDKIQISHLQFADDTLLLTQGDWRSLETIKAILQNFELVSGLKVNFSKSNLIGMNMPDQWLEQGANLLNCRRGAFPFKYLGLPVGDHPARGAMWQVIVEVVQRRLALWENKYISLAGRVILLKSVLSALPTYFLSFYKAPTGILSRIESIFKSFLWGGKKDHRKIHWLSWERVCRSKEEGGLGLCDLCKFNLALLGKWKWRMLTEPDSQWVRVLNSKYAKEDGS